MIQDIGKGRYHNEYRKISPEPDSRVLGCRGRELLVRRKEGELSFLRYQEVQELFPEAGPEAFRYLFAIDGTSYFWLPGLSEAGPETEKAAGVCWEPLERLRADVPRVEAFAGVTGHQLADWYMSRRFCPRCGHPAVHDEAERMMRCPACGQMEYPKLSPAVIVAVTHRDRILLTKYAGGNYRRYALVAGFAEIGETIEETVAREVMEETGLRVKNLRYYKSQPWSFTGTLLFGFFAELDGDDAIHLDHMELSEAKWCSREEVPEDDGVSLTREMMRVFREGTFL